MIFTLLGFQVGIPQASVYAQQEKEIKTELQHEVTVVLKLIQVHVTDKKGNPILDLEPVDFVIRDNGKVQTITDFERHVQPVQPAKREEITDETTPAEARDVTGQLNRKLIFVFDLARSSVQGLSKSKDTALHFLDTQVLPDDEIGVVTFSQTNGLVIHEYMSADHERVKHTIEGLNEIVGLTTEADGITLDRMRGGAEAVAGRSFADQFARAVDPEAEFDSSKDLSFFVQMEDLGKSLRYVPGYKNIILFSNGFPNYLYGQASRDAVHTGNLLFREYHDAMNKEMSTSNSPLFTVNAEGRRAQMRDKDNRGDYSLKSMSQVTGGEYFGNIDEHEEIAAQIQEATSNYYVLGYYIEEVWDGKYHELKVEVKRKDTRIRAQRGYYNPKPFSKFSRSEKLLQLLDLGMNDNPQSQAPERLPLLALACAESPDVNLAIVTEIPRDQLDEILRNKVQVVTMVFDEFNIVVDQLDEELDFDKIGEDFRYHAHVSSLHPGKYRCSVVVRNSETGKAAVGSADLEIPLPLESGSRLYPPLFLIPGETPRYYRFKQVKQAGGEEILLSALYPSSEEHSPLLLDLESRTDRILAIVRGHFSGIPAPSPELVFHLVRKEGGEKLPLTAAIVTSDVDGGTLIQTWEIMLPELESGVYVLETTSLDETAGGRYATGQDVRIK
jgi:VWFA-related protein